MSKALNMLLGFIAIVGGMAPDDGYMRMPFEDEMEEATEQEGENE